MWHFWGVEPGSKKMNVKANKGDREVEVLSAKWLGGPINGADAHLVSTMALGDPGVWKLDFYIDGEYFESVVVEVKENPQISFTRAEGEDSAFWRQSPAGYI